jgi:hypothetical protein
MQASLSTARNWATARRFDSEKAVSRSEAVSYGVLLLKDLAIPAFGYKNHIGIDRRHR